MNPDTFHPSIDLAQCVASAQGIESGCDRQAIFSARAMISVPRDRVFFDQSLGFVLGEAFSVTLPELFRALWRQCD